MSQGDHELLTAWRGGDRQAGGELIDRHFKALRRFFANKVGASEEVDDLVQRTFIACVEGVDRFRGDSSFRTWIFAVARNVLLQWLRERTKQQCLELGSVSVADLGIGPSSALHARREQQLLLAALREIPLESQLVLELYYWEQLNAGELAEVLELAVGTVRSRLRTAKLELRGALDALARSPQELESTVTRLDEWARGLREAWGV